MSSHWRGFFGGGMVLLPQPAHSPPCLLSRSVIVLTVANLRKREFTRRLLGIHRHKRRLKFKRGNDRDKETQRDHHPHRTVRSECCCWGCHCIRTIVKEPHPCYTLSGFKVWERPLSNPSHYKGMISSCSQPWETELDPARTFQGMSSLPPQSCPLTHQWNWILALSGLSACNAIRIVLLSCWAMIRATPKDDRTGNWKGAGSQRLCGTAIPALGCLLPDFF